jgi:hypothetical protein
MKNSKNLVIGLFASLVLTSCVNDTFDDPKINDCVNPGLTKTKEVADIWAMSTAATQAYTADDIIEGYVVSSDEGGNFYKSMYVQPTDGSKGFNLSIDEVSLYAKHFQPGKKVFLKLKGLSYANPSSYARGLVFGAAPTDVYAVDRLSLQNYANHLIPSCDIISEDAIVHHITLAQAIANDNYLNTLVEIDDVQFAEESIGGTYDPNRSDDYDASIYLVNAANSLAVRTSRYAAFAGSMVPSGRGTVRGVLTKYNSGYQIILRTERDVKLTLPRIDYFPPKIGTSIVYNPTINETFESYATSSSGYLFPGYVNDAHIGSRYWDVKSFSSNKYIQMTSFNSGGNNKTYLAVPVAFTPGNKLSFKSKDGYYNGNVLRVYYSTNYTPGMDMSQATLVDITSSFAIASGTTTGYATNFTNSGNFTIPASLTGNGFFIFEYSGSATVTTTMQIDDIKVNP